MKHKSVKIIHDLAITLSFGDLIRAIAGSDKIERMRNDVKWAHNAVTKLAHPKAIVGLFPIKQTGDRTVEITSRNPDTAIGLTTGLKTDLLTGARLAQVSVLTLGPEIDRLRKKIQNKGCNLRAFALDTAGIMALKQLGRRIDQMAENEAARLGWGVGYRIAPGTLLGWSLHDQPNLCRLLPLKEIGVRLSDSAMLTPLKSATALIGLGPEYPSANVKYACKWCQHKETCITQQR